jgi:hypothetical protein
MLVLRVVFVVSVSWEGEERVVPGGHPAIPVSRNPFSISCAETTPSHVKSDG